MLRTNRPGAFVAVWLLGIGALVFVLTILRVFQPRSGLVGGARQSADQGSRLPVRAKVDGIVEPTPNSGFVRETARDASARRTELGSLVLHFEVRATHDGTPIESARISIPLDHQTRIDRLTDHVGQASIAITECSTDRVLSLEVSAPNYFPKRVEIAPRSGSHVVRLRLRCSVAGHLDWVNTGTASLGGAWGIFAHVHRAAELAQYEDFPKPLHSASDLEALRTFNLARYEVAPSEWIEGNRLVAMSDRDLLSCLAMDDRAFRIDDLELGDICEIAVTLRDSDPVYVSCIVDRQAVDLGPIQIPGFSQIVVVLKDEFDDPVYPDPQLRVWCVNDQLAAAPVGQYYLRESAVRFSERVGTFAVFWGEWGQSYLVGVRRQSFASAARIIASRSESGSCFVTVVCDDRVSAPQVTCNVQGEDGTSIAGADVSLESASGELRACVTTDSTGAFHLESPPDPDDVVQVDATGWESARLRVEDVPPIVTLKRAPRVRFLAMDRRGKPIDCAAELWFFSDTGKLRKAAVWLRCGELVLPGPRPETRWIYLGVTGKVPRCLFDRETGWMGGDLVLDEAEECRVRFDLHPLGEEELLSRKLMRSVVFAIALPDRPSLSVPIPARIGADGSTSSISVWNLLHPMEAKWPKYGGGDVLFADLFPRRTRVGLEILVPIGSLVSASGR